MKVQPFPGFPGVVATTQQQILGAASSTAGVRRVERPEHSPSDSSPSAFFSRIRHFPVLPVVKSAAGLSLIRTRQILYRRSCR
jgi:hypothetical protein